MYQKLLGHESRVWDLTSNREGSRLYSASGDACVRIWDLTHDFHSSSEVLTGFHTKDIYGVSLDPLETHLATAGFDRSLGLWDIQTQTLVSKFLGTSDERFILS